MYNHSQLKYQQIRSSKIFQNYCTKQETQPQNINNYNIKMNYPSYRSSPIRNLQTSKAAREKLEDQFFQIKCLRLQREKQQLEDQVALLHSKIQDSGSRVEEILLLETKVSQLAEENRTLRLTIQELSADSTSIQMRTRQLYQFRQRTELEHRNQVQDLMRLYETAKAQTALFKSQNDRLRNASLRRSQTNEVQDLGKAMEMSKLKTNVLKIQSENQRLKEEIYSLQKDKQKINNLYNEQKRIRQQKERQVDIFQSQTKNVQQTNSDNQYYSVQHSSKRPTGVKLQKYFEEEPIVEKRLQEQIQLYEDLVKKYDILYKQHEHTVKERDQFREGAQFTLRENNRQKELQKSSRIKQKNERVSKSQFQRLQRLLKEKDDEIKSILNRFAPLLKIQAGQVSIEEDRKQRMDKHWKADLAILDVLLNKYKIQIFQL